MVKHFLISSVFMVLGAASSPAQFGPWETVSVVKLETILDGSQHISPKDGLRLELQLSPEAEPVVQYGRNYHVLREGAWVRYDDPAMTQRPLRPELVPNVLQDNRSNHLSWSSALERWFDHASIDIEEEVFQNFCVFARERLEYGGEDALHTLWSRYSPAEQREHFRRLYYDALSLYHEESAIRWSESATYFVGIRTYPWDCIHDGHEIGDPRLVRSLGVLDKPMVLEGGVASEKEYLLIESLFMKDLDVCDDLRFCGETKEHLIFKTGSRLFGYNKATGDFFSSAIPLTPRFRSHQISMASRVGVCVAGETIWAFGMNDNAGGERQFALLSTLVQETCP